jgi:glutaminyl-peptide cyclotransferase
LGTIFQPLNSYADLAKNTSKSNESFVKSFLIEFTQEPHPFGSNAQKKIAQKIQTRLEKFGIETSLQTFTSIVPDLNAFRMHQKGVKHQNGQNIIAKIKGQDHCAVLLGGHYDTKYIPNEEFIGANDGGSSTALLLETARVAKNIKFPRGSFGQCSLYFIFFDGEESVLPNWNDAKEFLKIQDNLYGSRAFVEKYITYKDKKTYLLPVHFSKSQNSIHDEEIQAILIFDMVGHYNQILSITRGSHEKLASQFLEANKNLEIKKSDIFIEDDHVSFLSYSAPVLHIIDWKNLNEWHTTDDNIKIISYEKIKKLSENLINFLKFQKYNY